MQRDTTTHYDLFSHQGGGPEGAEWNSDGSIYVVALVPYPTSEVGQVRLLLNRKLWTEDIALQSVGAFTLVTTTIPGPIWTSKLKPSSGSNERWLQGSEEKLNDQVASKKLNGVLKILDIDLHLQWRGSEVSFMRTFQWASGE